MSTILTLFTDGIINYLLFASVIAAVLTSLAWGIIKLVKNSGPSLPPPSLVILPYRHYLSAGNMPVWAQTYVSGTPRSYPDY